MSITNKTTISAQDGLKKQERYQTISHHNTHSKKLRISLIQSPEDHLPLIKPPLNNAQNGRRFRKHSKIKTQCKLQTEESLLTKNVRKIQENSPNGFIAKLNQYRKLKQSLHLQMKKDLSISQSNLLNNSCNAHEKVRNQLLTSLPVEKSNLLGYRSCKYTCSEASSDKIQFNRVRRRHKYLKDISQEKRLSDKTILQPEKTMIEPTDNKATIDTEKIIPLAPRPKRSHVSQLVKNESKSLKLRKQRPNQSKFLPKSDKRTEKPSKFLEQLLEKTITAWKMESEF